MKKIFSIFAMASMALMTAISCGKEDDKNALPLPDENAEVIETLQGLEVSPRSTYMVIGDTYQLEAVFSPENVGELKVSWSSETPEIASVDANGTVTALAKGLARITATAEGKSATAIVNVLGERVPATGIVLNKTEVSTLVGRYSKIKASLEPENTTDKIAIEWSTSNAQIASVESGVVIALAMGEATITAKQGDITATCKVTISDKIKLQDRSSAWTMTDTPKWDKNWNGQITGSHVDVALAGCDAEYHYFQIVSKEKGVDIESVANDLYMQVEERKDAGQSPANLFSKGETQTLAYKDLGEAIAYVLGFDEEFEFTGEYATYEFEAKTPDPVHATGIQFTQGWNNTPITSIELREGKTLNYFGAVLLPEDCTDTGSITFSSTDESVVTLRLYYSNYYTVVAGAPGEADIVAKFNDLEESIHVTVTGSSIVWTDRTAEWAGHFGIGKLYNYYDVFGFTLDECSSPEHFISVVKASDAGSDPLNNYKTIASQNADYLSWYASSDLPDFSGSYGDTDDTIERYAYVFGVNNGDYDGSYAIFHYVPGGGGTVNVTGIELDKTSASIVEGQTLTLTASLLPANQTENPTIEWSTDNASVATVAGGVVTAVAEGTATITASAAGFTATCDVTVTKATAGSGSRVVFDTNGQYIPVTWSSYDADQDNITLEGWFYPTNLGGSSDEALHCLFGTEGYFLLRFESNKLCLVYGSGESYRNDNKEYSEGKITASGTYNTNTWYHIAATYAKGGSIKLYVDGEEVGSATAPTSHGYNLNGPSAQYEIPFSFYIGAAAQPKRKFIGSMAYLRVWGEARSQQEIKDNMKVKNPTDNNYTLLANWYFDEGSGNTIKDATGYYDVTSNGTLKWESGTLPF
ncbi:MAG: Ig-like domain-containing protein [Bacteroidales bacterium]|nr:Ig-like domain-containing protein [Bacteroidales bacterium]